MSETDDLPVESPEEDDELPKSIRLHYIKSVLFRVIHTDGVIGGLTPSLDIHMDCWSQRAAIPRETVHEVQEDGTLGKEIRAQRVAREGLIREVEAGLVFNAEVAKELIKWLQDKVDKIAEIRKEKDEQSARKV
jgi:hypothetical protein